MSDRLFLALVALLPLHTVFFRLEVAWKPWLILFAAVAVLDLWQERRFPWPRRAALGVVIFLVAALVSWPGPDAGAASGVSYLALVAGGSPLMLVTGRHANRIRMCSRLCSGRGRPWRHRLHPRPWSPTACSGQSACGGDQRHLADRSGQQARAISHRDSSLSPTGTRTPGTRRLWTNVWIALSLVGIGRGVIRAPSGRRPW